MAGGLVVMATRGRRIFSRMLFSSPLDALVQFAQTPILHVRGYSCPVDLTARPSFEHALAAISNSTESSSLLKAVAAFGHMANGRQTLLHVIPSHAARPSAGALAAEESPQPPSDSAAPLEALANAWRAALPRARTSVVWSDLSPAWEVLAQAEERDVDFIALATRRRPGLSRLLRPGVFDQLVRRSRFPILVVAPGPEMPRPSTSFDPSLPRPLSHS
jgi:nucleotide-binding universal stress UspA family protein